MSGARHVLLDTCFGHGEHFTATCRAWLDSADPRPLHYIALATALPAASDIAWDALRAAWPTNVPGYHRIALAQGRVTLDLLVGDADACLAQLHARVDAFHVPVALAQPRALARLATPGATLRLHGAGEAHLKALRSAGFEWTAQEGGVSAVYTSRKPQPPQPAAPQREAIVIGAGLAGAAACERLAARGWNITLIERHAGPAQEASGNRAGIFMPLLSKDDNIPTRLSRAAYLYAMRQWQRLGGMDGGGDDARIRGASCGVLQLARDAGHAQLQREIVAGAGYPPEYVRWLDATAAGQLLGCATPHGGWLFEQGGWATPASVCHAMLEACGAKLTRLFSAEALRLERIEQRWRVRGADGVTIAEAANVIIANGAGALTLAQTAALPLYTMRGQVTHIDAGAFPALPLVVCREAYMTPPVDGIVSVGATYDSDGERALRAASQQENLSRARDILPGVLPAEPPLAGRVGFRCMAPDRLPLVGALPDDSATGRPERLRDVVRHAGLYGLLGYASRGLIWAPLAAELLAAQLEGEPLPLEASLAAALDPARFHLKARRQNPGVRSDIRTQAEP